MGPVDLAVSRGVDPLTPLFALLHRGRRLTCTEVAAVLQLDPWLSRVRVFQRKTTGAKRRRSEPPPPLSPPKRWGIAHEAEALRAYARRTGLAPRACGFVTHPEHPWLGGVPDGLVDSVRGGLLVEVKCPQVPHAVLPPPWHETQIQSLMQCCGVAACHYVEYRPGAAVRVVTVLRDDAWFAEALPVLRRFWEDVEEHRPPKVFRLDQ